MAGEVILVLKLVVGHFVVDYPLQGDFLARAKNHLQPIPGVPFAWALFAHAAIQAAMVWYLTGWPLLGWLEFIAHAIIDYLKSDQRISFSDDQIAHIACKVIYVTIMMASS